MPDTKIKSDAVTNAILAARAALAANAAKLEDDARALAALEAQIQPVRARGTKDVTAAVRAMSLHDQVVDLLRKRPADIAGLAQRLGAPSGRVSAVIRKLRDEGRLHNVGSDVEPMWFHVIGDDGSTEELKAAVLDLMLTTCRAFSHRELVVITGARENRISGVLAKLKDDAGTRVVNLGTGARGRWFVLPPDVKVSKASRS